jgi:hypothetical protein
MTVRDKIRLSRFEILGAWLGLWTPPRDAQVPPVPWRKVAAGAAGLVVLAVLVALFVAPAVDEAKDERAAAQQRELAERRAARRARQIREQAPRRGTLPTGTARAVALQDVEQAIGADARRRFSRRAAPATCEPAPGVDVAADRVAYDCVTSIRRIVGAGEQEGAVGDLGIPYRAVLDFARARYAFCKLNPIPGEQVIPDPRDLVRLDAACRIPQA